LRCASATGNTSPPGARATVSDRGSASTSPSPARSTTWPRTRASGATSGLYPQANGVSGNGGAGRLGETLGARPTLGEHFIANGFHSIRVGKLYHMRVPGDVTAGVDGPDHAASWTERYNCPGPEWATAGEPEALSNEELRHEPDVHYGLGFGTAFYTVRASDGAARQPDALAADKAIELLRALGDDPFFLAVGFVRPHVPLVAPGRFYDPFPPERMRLAEAVPGDREDIPAEGIARYTTERRGLQDPSTQRKVLSAYYASVAFLDRQVGRAGNELGRVYLFDTVGRDERRIRRADGVGIARQDEAGLRAVHLAEFVLAHVVEENRADGHRHVAVSAAGWTHANQLPANQLAPTDVAEAEQFVSRHAMR